MFGSRSKRKCSWQNIRGVVVAVIVIVAVVVVAVVIIVAIIVIVIVVIAVSLRSGELLVQSVAWGCEEDLDVEVDLVTAPFWRLLWCLT